MKVLRIISLAMLIVSSVPGCAPTRPTVSEASIEAFLEIVERRDFHEMARTGKEVFEPGHYIPDHAALFGQFPFTEPASGRVRYVLYSFRGQASVGEVYLHYNGVTGGVVLLSCIQGQRGGGWAAVLIDNDDGVVAQIAWPQLRCGFAAIERRGLGQ